MKIDFDFFDLGTSLWPFMSRLVYYLLTSVTRLGVFWKFLETNFPTQVAQNIGDYLGYFEKDHIM